MGNNQWMKFRHRAVRIFMVCGLGPYTRWKYNVKAEPFREQGDRAYLILFNHQTAFDQFFVELSFKGPVYYVASEDIFSKGWVSGLIRWLVAPIPIKKQVTDMAAVKNCLRVAKEGGTIALAPEGNRTYSGKTGYMNPAIASLARKLKLPIALYRIEGGYGIHPRWSDSVRKGSMRAYVSRVIEPEEYAEMSGTELLAAIEEGLYVDEGVADGTFECVARAEYLERAMYVCPFCGLSEFESHGHEITCKGCERKITYGSDKRLTGVGFEFPFQFVSDWYAYQERFVNDLDLTQMTDAPVYRDRSSLSEVVIYKHKQLLREEAGISLYGDRIVIDEGSDDAMTLFFSEISAMSVLGRNKLNIYHDDHVYQLKSDKRFNALKYVNFYFRHKNIVKGEPHGEFLGL